MTRNTRRPGRRSAASATVRTSERHFAHATAVLWWWYRHYFLEAKRKALQERMRLPTPDPEV